MAPKKKAKEVVVGGAAVAASSSATKPAAAASSSTSSKHKQNKAAPAKKKARQTKLPPDFTSQTFEKTDPVALRKDLKRHVKTLAAMVNADWHDGYEEQGEEACAWFRSLEAPLRAIYSVVDNNGTSLPGYRRLNKALLVMADSWVDMKAIPSRSNVGEMIRGTTIDLPVHKDENQPPKKKTKQSARSSDDDEDEEDEQGSTSSPDTAFTIVWSLLLHCAASDPKVKDEEMYRYIKDAADYRAIRVKKASSGDEGDRRLATLYAKKSEWNGLKSNYKVHHMRQAVDRRFSGSNRKRGRNEECIIS